MSPYFTKLLWVVLYIREQVPAIVRGRLPAIIPSYQVCDFEALKGRVLSASKAPQADDPRYPAMLDELKAIFNQYHKDGTVTLEYDTAIVYGQLSV